MTGKEERGTGALMLARVLQELVGLMLIIHLAAIVRKTVADDEVIDVQHHIVARNLIEDFLRDFHMRGLVLDDHLRTEVLSIEHCVTTL